ncbi:MAG: hypothetical protein ACOYNY_24885, partial [Caldilineaceae bacterium]
AFYDGGQLRPDDTKGYLKRGANPSAGNGPLSVRSSRTTTGPFPALGRPLPATNDDFSNSF